jgi:hypothetical protein
MMFKSYGENVEVAIEAIIPWRSAFTGTNSIPFSGELGRMAARQLSQGNRKRGEIRGCNKFCVNGHLAGHCHHRGNNDLRKTHETSQARS